MQANIPSGKRGNGVEIYPHGRFMTVTGNVIANNPIKNGLNTVFSLWQYIGGSVAPQESLLNSHVDRPESQSDNIICTVAANAANGDLFKALYVGDWQGKYPSQSEADQALCNIIAFYSDSIEQVIRVFRASALGKRDKAKRNDYVGNMARKAFDRKPPTLSADTLAVFQGLWPMQNNVPIPQAPKNNSVEVISMSDISEEKTEWLWEGYLPKGKLTLLAGAAGTGKSTIAFSMAATVSTGGSWPDNTTCTEPGTVMIFITEDDAADTIKPRVMAMGANNDRVCLIAATNHNGLGKMPFSPATDMPELKKFTLAHGGVSLLIIDPITSAVTGDMNKSNEVRRGLQSVVEFASELNCAVLGITHFAKGTNGRNPADRVIGSQAFAAFARMVLVAAKDEESSNRVFSRGCYVF